MSATHGPTTH